MKTLAVNGPYTLCYYPTAVNRYVVYKTTTASISGDIKIKQTVAQSPIFTKYIKEHFTPEQVRTAQAVVQAMRYVDLKFKG